MRCANVVNCESLYVSRRKALQGTSSSDGVCRFQGAAWLYSGTSFSFLIA